MKKRTKQTPNPSTEAAIAPKRLTFLLKSPQMKGPKKTEAIAPHEIESIVTITAGFSIAKIIERMMKKAELVRIKIVRDRSEAFLLK